MNAQSEQRRLLVVGGSSGIGRAIVEVAVDAGHRVVAGARRADLLEEIAGAVGIATDVRDPDQCARLVNEAVASLGGLDALVYAAGVVPLAPLVRSDTGTWDAVLETNLVGAALVTTAAVSHLEENSGRALYLSSDSVGRPFPGLVPYAASKAGLEEMVRGWAAEHPAVSFGTVVVGPTLTGMADGWDPAEAAEAFARWERDRYLGDRAPQAPERVAGAVLDLLTAAEVPPRIEVLPEP